MKTINPFSIRTWHCHYGLIFKRLLALAVIVTFVFPYLTWAFTASAFQTQPLVYFQQQGIEIPSRTGKITHQHQGQNNLVIHIQDLHCNNEVQNNIAGLLGQLARQYGLRLVCIEGASQAVNVGKLGSFPVEAVKKEVGAYFMQQGKLSGAEYYAALDKRIMLAGIERAEHYQASRESVARFLQDENQGYVWDLRDQLGSLKEKIYTPGLAKLDESKIRFRRGKQSLWQYGQSLAQAANRAGVAVSASSVLQRYLTGGADLEHEAVLAAMENLDQAVRERLYTHGKQRELDELEQRLDVVEKLLNISATAEEVAEVRQQRGDYQVAAFARFIQAEAGEEGVAAETAPLDAGVEEALKFYALADERSTDFVENVQARMQEAQTNLAVLITGGYHTAEVLQQLQAKGVSYVSIQPKVTHQDLVNPYFSLLRKRRTPLEKLLAQNQKVLSLEPYFAECPSAQAQAVLDEERLSAEQQSRNGIMEAALKLDLAQALREAGATTLEQLKARFEPLLEKYGHSSAQVRVDIGQGVLGRAASVFPVWIRKHHLCGLAGELEKLVKIPQEPLQAMNLGRRELRFYPGHMLAAVADKMKSSGQAISLELIQETIAYWISILSRLLKPIISYAAFRMQLSPSFQPAESFSGQMGKKLKVLNAELDAAGRHLLVSVQEEESRQKLEAGLDIDAGGKGTPVWQAQIKGAAFGQHRELVTTILSRLPEDLVLYFTPALLEDLFGFIVKDKNMVVLHSSLRKNPASLATAMFHEIGEYLLESGQMELHISPDKFSLQVKLNGQDLASIPLSGWALTSLKENKEVWTEWPVGKLNQPENRHYLLRFLQREIFGPADEDLTRRLKLEQNKKWIGKVLEEAKKSLPKGNITSSRQQAAYDLLTVLYEEGTVGEFADREARIFIHDCWPWLEDVEIVQGLKQLAGSINANELETLAHLLSEKGHIYFKHDYSFSGPGIDLANGLEDVNTVDRKMVFRVLGKFASQGLIQDGNFPEILEMALPRFLDGSKENNGGYAYFSSLETILNLNIATPRNILNMHRLFCKIVQHHPYSDAVADMSRDIKRFAQAGILTADNFPKVEAFIKIMLDAGNRGRSSLDWLVDRVEAKSLSFHDIDVYLAIARKLRRQSKIWFDKENYFNYEVFGNINELIGWTDEQPAMQDALFQGGICAEVAEACQDPKKAFANALKIVKHIHKSGFGNGLIDPELFAVIARYSNMDQMLELLADGVEVLKAEKCDPKIRALLTTPAIYQTIILDQRSRAMDVMQEVLKLARAGKIAKLEDYLQQTIFAKYGTKDKSTVPVALQTKLPRKVIAAHASQPKQWFTRWLRPFGKLSVFRQTGNIIQVQGVHALGNLHTNRLHTTPVSEFGSLQSSICAAAFQKYRDQVARCLSFIPATVAVEAFHSRFDKLLFVASPENKLLALNDSFGKNPVCQVFGALEYLSKNHQLKVKCSEDHKQIELELNALERITIPISGWTWAGLATEGRDIYSLEAQELNQAANQPLLLEVVVREWYGEQAVKYAAESGRHAARNKVIDAFELSRDFLKKKKIVLDTMTMFYELGAFRLAEDYQPAKDMLEVLEKSEHREKICLALIELGRSGCVRPENFGQVQELVRRMHDTGNGDVKADLIISMAGQSIVKSTNLQDVTDLLNPNQAFSGDKGEYFRALQVVMKKNMLTPENLKAWRLIFKILGDPMNCDKDTPELFTSYLQAETIRPENVKLLAACCYIIQLTLYGRSAWGKFFSNRNFKDLFAAETPGPEITGYMQEVLPILIPDNRDDLQKEKEFELLNAQQLYALVLEAETTDALMAFMDNPEVRQALLSHGRYIRDTPAASVEIAGAVWKNILDLAVTAGPKSAEMIFKKFAAALEPFAPVEQEKDAAQGKRGAESSAQQVLPAKAAGSRYFCDQRGLSLSLAELQAYPEVVKHMLTQIRLPQPQATAFDVLNEDDELSIISHFTAHVYPPGRLRAIFDIYFNSGDTHSHKQIDKYQLTQARQEPGAFYEHMDEGARKVHRQQERKLDYQFLLPFFGHFTDLQLRILPEAELFFKLFTSKQLHRYRSLKTAVRLQADLLAKNDTQESRRLFHLGLRWLDKKWGLATFSVKALSANIAPAGKNRDYPAYQMARELADRFSLFNDLIAAGENKDFAVKDPAREWKARLLARMEEALAPTADWKRLSDKVEQARWQFIYFFKNQKMAMIYDIFKKQVSEPDAEEARNRQLLIQYSRRLGVNQDGKNLFDSMFEFLRSNQERPEVVLPMRQALLQEAAGTFAFWRYHSPDYLDMWKRWVAMQKQVRPAAAIGPLLQRCQQHWERNQYYTCRYFNRDENKIKNIYLGFTDNFATLLNLGNPSYFGSCQATCRPAYNRGLAGTTCNGWNKTVVIFDEDGKMLARRIVRLRLSHEGELFLVREETYGSSNLNKSLDTLLAKVAHDMGVRYQPDRAENATTVKFALKRGHSEWDYSDSYGKQFDEDVGLIRIQNDQELNAALTIPLMHSEQKEIGRDITEIDEAFFKLIADKVQAGNGDEKYDAEFSASLPIEEYIQAGDQLFFRGVPVKVITGMADQRVSGRTLQPVPGMAKNERGELYQDTADQALFLLGSAKLQAAAAAMKMATTTTFMQTWKDKGGWQGFVAGHVFWGVAFIEELGIRTPGLTAWQAFWMGRIPALAVPLIYLTYCGFGLSPPLMIPLGIITATWLVYQVKFVRAHPNKDLPDIIVRSLATLLFMSPPLLVTLFALSWGAPALAALAVSAVLGPVAGMALHVGWNKHAPKRFEMTMIPEKSYEQAQIASLLDPMLGNFPARETLKNILSSLGTPTPGQPAQELDETDRKKLGRLYEEDKAGCHPFTLSGAGRLFFQDLLGLETAPEAYLLTLESSRPYMQEIFKRAGVASGFPYALVFRAPGREELLVFDLTEFILEPRDALNFYAFNQASQVAELLLPAARRERHLALILEETPEPAVLDQTREKLQSMNFDGCFKMMRVVEKTRSYDYRKRELDDLGLFPPNDYYSRDFQDMLTTACDEFRGRKAGITGVGLGQDLLRALRFGATSVYANELSRPQWQLAVWNYQYAKETGQVPILPLDKVRITLGKDFEGIPEDAELLVFNTPSIHSTEGKAEESAGMVKTKADSNFISRPDFDRIFSALRTRLARQPSQAIWRIMAAPSSGLAEITKTEMEQRGGYWTNAGEVFVRQQLAAEKLLHQAGLSGQQIEAHHLIYRFYDPLAGRQAVLPSTQALKSPDLKNLAAWLVQNLGLWGVSLVEEFGLGVSKKTAERFAGLHLRTYWEAWRQGRMLQATATVILVMAHHYLGASVEILIVIAVWFAWEFIKPYQKEFVAGHKNTTFRDRQLRLLATIGFNVVSILAALLLAWRILPGDFGLSALGLSLLSILAGPAASSMAHTLWNRFAGPDHQMKLAGQKQFTLYMPLARDSRVLALEKKDIEGRELHRLNGPTHLMSVYAAAGLQGMVLKVINDWTAGPQNKHRFTEAILKSMERAARLGARAVPTKVLPDVRLVIDGQEELYDVELQEEIMFLKDKLKYYRDHHLRAEAQALVRDLIKYQMRLWMQGFVDYDPRVLENCGVNELDGEIQTFDFEFLEEGRWPPAREIDYKITLEAYLPEQLQTIYPELLPYYSDLALKFDDLVAIYHPGGSIDQAYMLKLLAHYQYSPKLDIVKELMAEILGEWIASNSEADRVVMPVVEKVFRPSNAPDKAGPSHLSLPAAGRPALPAGRMPVPGRFIDANLPDEFSQYLFAAKGIQITGYLGSGNYGHIYSAQDQAGRKLAVKINKKRKSLDTAETQKTIAKLKGDKHPNLLLPLEVNAIRLASGKITEYQIMGRIDQEPYFDLWQQQAYTPQAEDRIYRLFPRMFEHIMSAAAFLHHHGVYHGDIKIPNILSGKDGFCLIDITPLPMIFMNGQANDVDRLERVFAEMIRNYALPPALEGSIKQVLENLENMEPGDARQYAVLLEKIREQAKLMDRALGAERILLSPAEKQVKADLAEKVFRLGQQVYGLPMNTFAADSKKLKSQLQHFSQMQAMHAATAVSEVSAASAVWRMTLSATLELLADWQQATGVLSPAKRWLSRHQRWGIGFIEEFGVQLPGYSQWQTLWQSRLPILALPVIYLLCAFNGLNLLLVIGLSLAAVMARWWVGAQNHYVEEHDNSRDSKQRTYRRWATVLFNLAALAPGILYFAVAPAAHDPVSLAQALAAILAGPVFSTIVHVLWNLLAPEKYHMTVEAPTDSKDKTVSVKSMSEPGKSLSLSQIRARLADLSKQVEEIYRQVDHRLPAAVNQVADFPLVAAELMWFVLIQGGLEGFGTAFVRLVHELPGLQGRGFREGLLRLAEYAASGRSGTASFLEQLGRVHALAQMAHTYGEPQEPFAGEPEPGNPAGELPFLDLASGTLPSLHFQRLSPKRRYVFVDKSELSKFVKGHLSEAAEGYGVQNQVEVWEQDVRSLRLQPGSLGTLRLKNLSGYIEPETLPAGWFERMAAALAPGGKVVVVWHHDGEADSLHEHFARIARQQGWRTEEGYMDVDENYRKSSRDFPDGQAVWKVWIATAGVVRKSEPRAENLEQENDLRSAQGEKAGIRNLTRPTSAAWQEAEDSDYNRPTSEPASRMLQRWRAPRAAWLAVLWAGFLLLDFAGRASGQQATSAESVPPDAGRRALDKMLWTYLPGSGLEAVYFRPTQLQRSFGTGLAWREKWLGRYRGVGDAAAPELVLEQSLVWAFATDQATGEDSGPQVLRTLRTQMAYQIIRHTIAYRSADFYQTGPAPHVLRLLAPYADDRQYALRKANRADRPGDTLRALGWSRQAGSGTAVWVAGLLGIKANALAHRLGQRLFSQWYLRMVEKGIRRELKATWISQALRSRGSRMHAEFERLGRDPRPEIREAFAQTVLAAIRELPASERLANLGYFSELLVRMQSLGVQVVAVRASGRDRSDPLPERIVLPAVLGEGNPAVQGWLGDVLGPEYRILEDTEFAPQRRRLRLSNQQAA